MKGGIIYILAFRDTEPMDGSTLASTDCWLRLKEPANNAKTISLVLRVRYCLVCVSCYCYWCCRREPSGKNEKDSMGRPVHTKMKLNFILFCWFLSVF